MPYLDLDFKEARCTLRDIVLLILLLFSSIFSFYLWQRLKRQTSQIKKEARVVFTCPMKPIALLKDTTGSLLLMQFCHKKSEILKNNSYLTINGIRLKVHFNENEVLLKGNNFSRRIAW